MTHSTHTPAFHAQGQLSFHPYTAVTSKCMRPCNCYCYWRQEILFAILQLSGDVWPAAMVDIWMRVQIPAILRFVLEMCVTALHNYKFEDWGFIIRVLMYSKGSMRLTLSHDTQNKCVWCTLWDTAKRKTFSKNLYCFSVHVPWIVSFHQHMHCMLKHYTSTLK
jgi:hypothetical protein